MNQKRKWIYGFVILVLVLGGALQWAHVQYYNPYQNYLDTREIFVTLSQLTHPDVMSFSLDQNRQSKFSLHYFQQFKIKKGDIYSKEKKEYVGNLIYDKNDAIAETDHQDEILKNIKTQKFFMEPQKIEIKNSLKKGNYHYYLACKQPKDLMEVLSVLSSVYGSEYAAKNKFEIAWIPILTSQNADDMAIGLRGTARGDNGYAYDGEYSSRIAGIYKDGAFAREEIFFQESIKSLFANPRDAKVACSTGLFGRISEQDLLQRLTYVKEKGTKAIGVVCVADETFIHHALCSDFILVQIDEVEPAKSEKIKK